MRYELIIDETALTVEATQADEASCWRLAVVNANAAADQGDETPAKGAAAAEQEPGVEMGLTAISAHAVGLAGPEGARTAWVAANPGPAGGAWIWVEGRARLVQDAAAQRRARRGAGSGVGKDVTPPMPAVVQKVLVAVGDAVEMGQGLVVVSAMKLELTLVAPFAGTVAAIHTEEGAKVNPGDILVDITAAAAGQSEAG